MFKRFFQLLSLSQKYQKVNGVYEWVNPGHKKKLEGLGKENANISEQEFSWFRNFAPIINEMRAIRKANSSCFASPSSTTKASTKAERQRQVLALHFVKEDIKLLTTKSRGFDEVRGSLKFAASLGQHVCIA